MSEITDSRRKTGTSRDSAGTDLASLYEQHAASGFRLAYVLTGNTEDARDLLHEGFIRSAARSRSLRDPHAFGAYLHRTMVNLQTSRWRRKATERKHAHAFALGEAVEARDVVTEQHMWAELMTLPSRQRAALYLRFYEDRTEADAAAALGCSPRAVRSLVQRGISTLRDRYEVNDATD